MMGIRGLFIERLNRALSEENYTLADDPEGPSVAFAVNGSRLESDLKRDLKNGVQFHLETMTVSVSKGSHGPLPFFTV